MAVVARECPRLLRAVIPRVLVIDHPCPFPTRAKGIKWWGRMEWGRAMVKTAAKMLIGCCIRSLGI